MVSPAQTLEQAQRLVADDPKKVAALASLAAALHEHGELHWSKGEPETADLFHRALATNETRVTVAPADASGPSRC